MEIGFYSHVNTKPKATKACLESVRKFHPQAHIFISCDNAFDFSLLCEELNVKYDHNEVTLGYPTQPFGYRKDGVIEWLDRMYRGVNYLGSKGCDYFVMLEDDVVLVDRVTVNPDWEMAGQPFLYEDQVPPMPEAFLDIIEKVSGKRPSRGTYNCGGGSIFKVRTFLNNYEWIRTFLLKNLDYIQDKVYPTLGWMDCFMCVFYYLCKAELVENKKLYNNFPVKTPFNFSSLPPGIEIVHNFKDYY